MCEETLKHPESLFQSWIQKCKDRGITFIGDLPPIEREILTKILCIETSYNVKVWELLCQEYNIDLDSIRYRIVPKIEFDEAKINYSRSVFTVAAMRQIRLFPDLSMENPHFYDISFSKKCHMVFVQHELYQHPCLVELINKL